MSARSPLGMSWLHWQDDHRLRLPSGRELVYTGVRRIDGGRGLRVPASGSARQASPDTPAVRARCCSTTPCRPSPSTSCHGIWPRCTAGLSRGPTDRRWCCKSTMRWLYCRLTKKVEETRALVEHVMSQSPPWWRDSRVFVEAGVAKVYGKAKAVKHSPSSLGTFATCPKRFWHERVAKDVEPLPPGSAALLGTEMHRQIEHRGPHGGSHAGPDARVGGGQAAPV